MFTTAQILGFVAQALGMSQDALEKSLISNLTKLDKSVQDIYMFMGNISNNLAKAPGETNGSGRTGQAAPGGLIAPEVIAVLPPLQNLDSALSDLLVKLEPSIKLLLQLRDAAEKAASSNETLTSSLAAMAVAARGISNLMSGQRADGGPRREPGQAARLAALTGEALQRAIPGATAAKESKPVYYTGFPNMPTPDHIYTGPTPVYGNVPDKITFPDKINVPEVEILPPNPLASMLPDGVAAEILGYLARFEPILIGIDAKCEETLKSMFKMDSATLEILKNWPADGRSKNSGDESNYAVSKATDASVGIGAAGVAAMLIAAVGAPATAVIGAFAALFFMAWETGLLKEMEEYRDNLKYEYLNKFYVRPNPNRKGNEQPKPKLRSSKLEDPNVTVSSAVESISPTTISNITNNYYDSTTNNNLEYHRYAAPEHDLNQTAFNRCLDKAMIKLVRDVESGMRTC